MKPLFTLVLCTAVLSMQFAINDAAFGVVRWNKRTGNFDPIPALPFNDERRKTHPRLKNENDTVLSRLREIHNFNEQPLHLTYYQTNAFVEFYDNDTMVSGIYGDLWRTLSEMLNFTLVVQRSEVTLLGTPLENGSYSGILEDARLNQTDVIPMLEVVAERGDAVTFTTPFWVNRYRTSAHGLWQPDRAWMFKQFTPAVWCLIIIFIVILSVAGLAMQRALTRHKCPMLLLSFLDHVFDTIATMCNQGNSGDSKSNAVKTLAVTVSIFSWFLLVAYSARLIYSMASEIFASPFQDMSSLYRDTSIHVVVTNGSMGHLFFTHSKRTSVFNRLGKANRIAVVSSVEELNRRVCLNSKKFVLLDGDDEIRARRMRSCSVYPANAQGVSVPMASGVSKRVKNKRSIDIAILKLHEAGITDAIKNRYLSLKEEQSFVKETESLAIDLDQLSLLLVVLASGFVASLVVCVAENIVFALEKRRNYRRLLRRLPVIERSMYFRNMPVENCSSSFETSGKLFFTERSSYFPAKPKMLLRPLIRDD